MNLLDNEQIARKITRLALEILERNTEENELYIIGINHRGMELAERLVKELESHVDSPLHLRHLTIDPASPLTPGPEYKGDINELVNKAVLIVDDVANTGRTLFYALRPFQDILPSKIEVAVLVDRRHKSWPIYVTYCGLELSTTLGDHVQVSLGSHGNDEAILE